MPLKKKSGHRQFHGRETWGQRSEVGGRKAEDGRQRTDDRRRRLGLGFWRENKKRISNIVVPRCRMTKWNSEFDLESKWGSGFPYCGC